MNDILPGSKWRSTDYILFYVIRTEERNGDTWVFYRRDHDGQEFNCLAGAFLHRFQEDKSHRSQ
jgi:hypothetical protein